MHLQRRLQLRQENGRANAKVIDLELTRSIYAGLLEILMHRLFPVHGSDGAVPAGIGGYGWHIVFPLIVDNASAIPPFLKGCQRAPAGLCLILEVSDEPPLIANASFHHLPGCSIPSSYTTKGASTARGTGLSSQPWCQHALALAPSRTSALATHSTVETSRMHADMSF